MIDKKQIQLMNKAIDGVINTREKEHLDAYLQKDPAARKFYNDLLQTADLLSQTSKVEPSPNLKKRVMNAVDFSRYDIPKKESSLKSLISQLMVQSKPQLAYIFAFGIVIGFIIYSLFLSRYDKTSALRLPDLIGTMGITEKTQFETLSEVPIKLPQISGAVAVKQYGSIIGCEMNLESETAFEFTLQYDESKANFIGLHPYLEKKLQFQSTLNTLKIFTSGKNETMLIFERGKQENYLFDISLSSSGNMLWRQKISVTLKKR
jgi:hypothetical protein